ncbi:hypothetical protein D3C87_2012150 [compost metagenome]
MGVGDETDKAKVQLNSAQRDIAVSTLENLQALATEMMMYGSIANAVTWDKIKNVKRLNIEQEQFNNQIQEQLGKMRGLLPGAR